MDPSANKDKDIDPDYPKALIKAAVVDDEYGKGKAGSEATYYSIAHTLREPISEQPRMVAFGQLKQYQVLHVCGIAVLHWQIVAF